MVARHQVAPQQTISSRTSGEGKKRSDVTARLVFIPGFPCLSRRSSSSGEEAKDAGKTDERARHMAAALGFARGPRASGAKDNSLFAVRRARSSFQRLFALGLFSSSHRFISDVERQFRYCIAM